MRWNCSLKPLMPVTSAKIVSFVQFSLRMLSLFVCCCCYHRLASSYYAVCVKNLFACHFFHSHSIVSCLSISLHPISDALVDFFSWHLQCHVNETKNTWYYAHKKKVIRISIIAFNGIIFCSYLSASKCVMPIRKEIAYRGCEFLRLYWKFMKKFNIFKKQFGNFVLSIRNLFFSCKKF